MSPSYWRQTDTRSLGAAFYHSPAREVSRAQWGVAEGGVVTAGGRPNRAANLALGYNASASGQVFPWITDAMLDLPLEIAGRRGIRIAEARHRSEAARLNLFSTAC